MRPIPREGQSEAGRLAWARRILLRHLSLMLVPSAPPSQITLTDISGRPAGCNLEEKQYPGSGAATTGSWCLNLANASLRRCGCHEKLLSEVMDIVTKICIERKAGSHAGNVGPWSQFQLGISTNPNLRHNLAVRPLRGSIG